MKRNLLNLLEKGKTPSSLQCHKAKYVIAMLFDSLKYPVSKSLSKTDLALYITMQQGMCNSDKYILESLPNYD